MRTIGALLVSGMLLCGCGSTGLRAVLDENGPLDRKTETGVVKRFYDAEQQAFKDPSNPALAYAMFATGQALVRENCTTFFGHSGETQKWVLVSRDGVAAAGSITAAVMALGNHSTEAVARVMLATAGVTTGLDIYTKYFLFGADNVYAVYQLTSNALGEHAKAVGLVSDKLDYAGASAYLMENQSICTFSSIRKLAVDAIAAGKVAPANVPNLAPGAPTQDQIALLALGKELNPPGALSADEAFRLWWLLEASSSDDDKKLHICPGLSAIPAATNPCTKTGTYVAAWPKETVVRQILEQQMSEATKSGFRTKVKTEQETKTQAAATGTQFVSAPLKSLPAHATIHEPIKIQVMK